MGQGAGINAVKFSRLSELVSIEQRDVLVSGSGPER